MSLASTCHHSRCTLKTEGADACVAGRLGSGRGLNYASGANLLLSVKQGLLPGLPYRRVASGLVRSVRDDVGASVPRQPGSLEVLKGTVEKVH